VTATVRARYRAGKLELLEPLEMEEGAEVTVTVNGPEPSPAAIDPITASAGGWKDLLDCEQFEKDVYESRLIQTRPEVRW
jgi:predicted DNA-binding antitoxin AbrB/MazE fold protein